MIVIIDYDMGNVGSIANMLGKIGHDSKISNSHEDIAKADKIILPGVGAFDHAVKNLQRYDLIDLLNKKVLEDKVPILGICVGMQLLASGSEEGELKGLGWIPGVAKRFRPNDERIKVPHMGWNTLKSYKKDHPLFRGFDDQEIRFYFVHTYHVDCEEESSILASSHHGYNFNSAVGRDNIMGTQFHPEKSHRFGMQLLKSFAEISS